MSWGTAEFPDPGGLLQRQPSAYKCDMSAQAIELVCERGGYFHPIHRCFDVVEPFNQRFALLRCQLCYEILLYPQQLAVPSEDT